MDGVNWKSLGHAAGAMLAWSVVIYTAKVTWDYWWAGNIVLGTTYVRVEPRPWRLVALTALALALAVYLTVMWERQRGPNNRRRH